MSKFVINSDTQNIVLVFHKLIPKGVIISISSGNTHTHTHKHTHTHIMTIKYLNVVRVYNRHATTMSHFVNHLCWPSPSVCIYIWICIYVLYFNTNIVLNEFINQLLLIIYTNLFTSAILLSVLTALPLLTTKHVPVFSLHNHNQTVQIPQHTKQRPKPK